VPAANFVWLGFDSQSFIAAWRALVLSEFVSRRQWKIAYWQATVPGLDTAGLHPANLPRPIADFSLSVLVRARPLVI